MNKIVKNTLVSTMATTGTFTAKDCGLAMSTLIEAISTVLVNDTPIRINGMGKIVPYFKKGSRPVRNPKTGEESLMKDKVVVSFATPGSKNRANPNNSTVSLINLIDKVASKLEGIDGAKELAKLAVDVFTNAAIESREKCVNLEIRHFGVLRTKEFSAANQRNPKTGEKIVHEEGATYKRTIFRASKSLSEALNAKLGN